MPAVHSKMLIIAFTVALLLHCASQFSDVDLDDEFKAIESELVQQQLQWDSIADIPAKDVYNDIYNTVWFKHHTGVCEGLFDIIYDGIGFDITEARNIYFEYSARDNYYRRRRPCKISTHNRIIHFLHTMRTGNIVWDAAHENNWNIASCSMDFFHVLIHFVNTFEDTWIRQMTDEEKDNGCHWPAPYDTCYQAADGVHFHRRKSKRLPDGLRRRELYLYKHKYPEGQNVQAVVNHFGVATQVVTGT